MASREVFKVLSPGTMWSVAYSRMTTYSESPAPLSSPADQRRYSVCLPAVAMSITYSSPVIVKLPSPWI